MRKKVLTPLRILLLVWAFCFAVAYVEFSSYACSVNAVKDEIVGK